MTPITLPFVAPAPRDTALTDRAQRLIEAHDRQVALQQQEAPKAA